MSFLRKYSLGTIILLLAAICLGLYLFLVRPMLVRKQGAVKAMEEKLAQLQRHRDDPPSPEVIVKLSQKKEELESQYEGAIKVLNFPSRVSLPEDTGDPLFLDEQIESFKRQIERAESELGRLVRGTDINLPERLGFREERPESREELSMLWSQLVLVRELVTLAIEAGVSELFLLNPLPPPREGEVTLPRERMEIPPGREMREMEMPPGFELPPGLDVSDRQRRVLPVEEDRFIQVLGLEKLEFELGVRAEISALTNLLHQIANHSYFFAVKDLEVRPVAVRRERALPEVREREGRRRRRVPPEMEILPGIEPEEEEELAEEVGRKLEARILVSTRLLPLPEED